MSRGLATALGEARSGGPRRFDGADRAAITALACTPAPTGHSRWTSRLLADSRGAVPGGNHFHETVAQVLKNEVQPQRQQHWCLGK
ncbi:MAG: hypothetical protein WKG07_20320 [Hymenobacter sp.]